MNNSFLLHCIMRKSLYYNATSWSNSVLNFLLPIQVFRDGVFLGFFLKDHVALKSLK